jgi:hypothetical protein
MREIRQSGSEGGGDSVSPYPYHCSGVTSNAAPFGDMTTPVRSVHFDLTGACSAAC